MATLSERVKGEVSLRQLAERFGVSWDAAKSRPHAGDFWAPCPFHGESTSSFHLVEANGRGGWFKCFGCGAKGTAVDFWIAAYGGTAGAALKALADAAGLQRAEAPEVTAAREARRQAQIADMEAKAAREAERNFRAARRIWAEAEPGHSSQLLADYLTARGVDVDAMLGIPATLRLHPALKTRAPDGSEYIGPAMVAAIGTAGDFRGVHRTWITPRARATDATGAKIAKAWLGRTGAMFGSPVRFCAPSDWVVVGEGIETTLAVWSRMQRKARHRWSAEAALSLGALAGPADPAGMGPGLAADGKPLPSAVPDFDVAKNPGWMPPGLLALGRIGRVLILGEGSAKCPASAQRHGLRALRKLTGTADRVRLIVPRRDWSAGLDYADLAAMGEI